MAQPNVPPENRIGEWTNRRADLIVVGDRISQEFLPLWGDKDAEAIFVKPHEINGTKRIFIAFAQDDGYHDSMSLLPDSVVSVLPAETGQSYSRADDGETPQPLAGRTPTHIGDVKSAITMDGHRDGEPVITGEVGETPDDQLSTKVRDAAHVDALVEDNDRATGAVLADLRDGESGRIANPKMARFLAEREEKRRAARHVLGLEESHANGAKATRPLVSDATIAEAAAMEERDRLAGGPPWEVASHPENSQPGSWHHGQIR